jgi:ubiquinone biosynthesis protein Coq4
MIRDQDPSLKNIHTPSRTGQNLGNKVFALFYLVYKIIEFLLSASGRLFLFFISLKRKNELQASIVFKNLSASVIRCLIKTHLTFFTIQALKLESQALELMSTKYGQDFRFSNEALRSMGAETVGYALYLGANKAKIDLNYLCDVTRELLRESYSVQNDRVNSDSAWFYIRSQQCHEVLHTLTGAPRSILGEVYLTWFQYYNVTNNYFYLFSALLATFGALSLNPFSSYSIIKLISKAKSDSKKLPNYYGINFETFLSDNLFETRAYLGIPIYGFLYGHELFSNLDLISYSRSDAA